MASLALALTVLPQAPAQAAAHNPQPQQPVIHFLPHPVLVPAPTTTSTNVYLVCLSSAPTHCLALDSANTIIVVTALITAICQFVDCPQMLRDVVSHGSTSKKGDLTMVDEGGYLGHGPTNFVHNCIGANPTASDQHDGVYFSSPGKCFGPLQESWKYTIEPGKGFRYDLLNRQAEHEHRVYAMANLNLRNGAFVYVKPNVQPGLWTTWSFYKVGTCNPC